MRSHEEATAAPPQPTGPPPPARTPTAPQRGSDYAQLSRQVKQAGLLERRPGRYVWKITVTATLLAAGWAVFVLVGDSWWQLAVAVFLAHRLRATVAGLGYSGGDQPNLSADQEDPDEMDPELLDNLALGAARFEWLMNRMKR